MENTCIFISSRGIAKSCTFYPQMILSDTDHTNSYNTDYLKKMLKSKMFDGMSIYVISNVIPFFSKEIMPKIKHKFILVSGSSTKTCPNEILNEKEFNFLINNKYLIRWCSQNNVIYPSRIIKQIPLGLDYHTIINNHNHCWRDKNEGVTPIEQEKILKEILLDTKPFYNRITNKIYTNFSMNADRYKQRKMSLEKIPKKLLDFGGGKHKRTKTWKFMTKFAFILSPYGNGMDCHRHWESLILGCIPIIKSTEFENMFGDLPVLNVKDWSDINQQLLDDTIEKFKNKKFNMEKVNLEYWKNIIFQHNYTIDTISKIPYTLYKTGPFEKCPPEVTKVFEKNNKMLNTTIEYFNDNMCREFIKNNFREDVLSAYDILIPTAYKADLWRLCVLYINGGIYGDLTQFFTEKFDVNEKNPDMVFVKDRPDNSIQVSFMATIKKNPFIEYIINNLTEKILNHDRGTQPIDVTGPITIGKYFLSYFNISNITLGFHEYVGLNKIKYKIYIPFRQIDNNFIENKDKVKYITIRIDKHRDLVYKKYNNKHYGELWKKNNIFNQNIKGTWVNSSRNIKYIHKNKLICELKNRKEEWIKNELVFSIGDTYENINGKFVKKN